MLPWDAFLERYLPLARAIATKLAAPGIDAEDLVQEAAASLYAAWKESPGRFADAIHARNYLLRAVRNQAARSRDRSRPALPLSIEPAQPVPGPASRAWSARRARLDRLVAELAPEERELVTRRFLERETLAQISAATGVPVSTLHARERRALDRLRERLRRMEEEDGG